MIVSIPKSMYGLCPVRTVKYLSSETIMSTEENTRQKIYFACDICLIKKNRSIYISNNRIIYTYIVDRHGYGHMYDSSANGKTIICREISHYVRMGTQNLLLPLNRRIKMADGNYDPHIICDREIIDEVMRQKMRKESLDER